MDGWRRDNRGRALILGTLKMQQHLENKDDEYGYSVFSSRGSVKSVSVTDVPPGSEVVLASDGYPELFDTLDVSKNLIEFMNDYPRCNDWNNYAFASLSKQAKDGFYPVLRQSIEGKAPKKAVDVLLDFVQTAFDYQTDEQQFGKERPLFGDETLEIRDSADSLLEKYT